MLYTKALLLLVAFSIAAPAHAADDPAAKAEALLKTWRDKGGMPLCQDLLAVTPQKGVDLERTGPGAELPHFTTAAPGRKWNGLCELFFEPMVIEGFFAGPPFCKRTGDTTALCTLMTATSQPRVLVFRLAPDRPEGVVIERIAWQRKAARPVLEDDDDDLPM